MSLYSGRAWHLDGFQRGRIPVLYSQFFENPSEMYLHHVFRALSSATVPTLSNLTGLVRTASCAPMAPKEPSWPTLHVSSQPIWFVLFLIFAVNFPAPAYSPPLQNISVNLENSGSQWRASFTVYDSIRDAWQSADSGWFEADIAWLKTNNGVVIWESRTGTGNLTTTTLGYAVYDPALGSWQMTNTGAFLTPISKAYTQDGTVVWQEQPPGGSSRFIASIYDPVLKTWITLKSDPMGGTLDFSCMQNTATAHEGYGSTWYARLWMFDPLRHEWRTDRFGPFNSSTWAIGVEDGSVRLYVGSQRYLKGYNYLTGNWYDGTTLPLAAFSASRLTGYAPLGIWFTDLSLGASHWTWSFGDGSIPSTKRCPSHVFFSPGSQVVTLSVWGMGGEASTNTLIGPVVGPRLSLMGISNGTCYLRLSGRPGSVHLLEKSFELNFWYPVQWLTNVSGILNVEDPVTDPAAFYRTQLSTP